MKIPQNKDLEADYKNEIIKGLDGRDLLFGGIGVCITIITAVTVGFYLKIDYQLCILIGVIPAIPVFIVGFYKIQGMTVFEYFKEYLYDKMTEELYYDADELPEDTEIWTMERTTEKGKKRR